MAEQPRGPQGTPTHPVSAKREFKVPTVEMSLNDAGLSVQDLRKSTLDPERHYAWVRDDETQLSVRRRERNGYELETYREGGPEPEAGKQPDQADNVIRMGDSVLMSRPKILHERAVDAKFQRSEARLNSTTDQLREEADKKGFKVIGDRRAPNE